MTTKRITVTIPAMNGEPAQTTAVEVTTPDPQPPTIVHATIAKYEGPRRGYLARWPQATDAPPGDRGRDVNSRATPPDRAEPTPSAPETQPPLGPSSLVNAAIERARGLLAQMAPRTAEEAAAHDRAMTGLDKLQRHLGLSRDGRDRPTATAVALAINLGSHPAPAQAQEKHLVRPLLLAASSVSAMRAVKPWLDEWLREANDGVLADIQARRDQERGPVS
jgi:hypothetical protein